MIKNDWFVVEPTHLKKNNIYIGSFPQVGGKLNTNWNHQPDPRNLQQDLLNEPLNLRI